MKCPQCSHESLEKAPNFCSRCGCKMTSQLNEIAADKPQDEFQTSLNIPHSTDAEMTDIGHESEALDYQNANVSPKRPNEDIIPNPKKKKRKKKKKKKAGVAEGPSSLTSDLSDISLTEKEKKMEEDQSSDSDGSYCTVDDMPKPAESSSHLSPPETETAEPKQHAVSALHIDAAVGQSDERPNSSEEICIAPEMTETSKSQSTQELFSISTDKASPAVTMGANQKAEEDKVKSKNKGRKSVSKREQTTLDRDGDMDQNANIKSSTGNQRETDEQDVGAPINCSSSGDSSVKVKQSQKQQSAHADQKNTASEKQNISEEAASTKTKKNQNEELQNSSQDMVLGPQNKSKKNHGSSGDSSAKVEQSEKQQSAGADQKNAASEKQNKNGKAETSTDIQHVSSPKTKKNQNQEPQNSSQDMVFGQQSKSKKNHGSSGDSPVNVKQGQKQQQSGHGKKDSAVDQKHKESDDTESRCVVLPKRNSASNQHISSSDKLTIYFHAVLSKDFKFKPEEDYVFIRAGSHIGSWEKDLVELFVTRDLGEHGFLVEGKFVCKKTDAESVSIPYKYVVYKAKKEKYELHYEYIYKLDSDETTNRCLFVKTHLLNDEGEWHQYDDIICQEPSKKMFEWIRKAVWPDHKKGILQGRQIAGTVMLETIFDLLRSWSKINLSNFFSQLKQFYGVYGNPFVFEKTHTKWSSLDYSEKDVRKLLKQFMLERVTPELQKDDEEKSKFIKEPLKAGLIMLYVWQQYHLELDKGTLSRLCTALCLPKLPNDKFLSFWTDITESFSVIKNLSDMVKELINRVKAEDMPKWIIVIPLLHLLKGTSKPFEPVSTKVNSQHELSWVGLQGIKSANHITPPRRY